MLLTTRVSGFGLTVSLVLWAFSIPVSKASVLTVGYGHGQDRPQTGTISISASNTSGAPQSSGTSAVTSPIAGAGGAGGGGGGGSASPAPSWLFLKVTKCDMMHGDDIPGGVAPTATISVSSSYVAVMFRLQSMTRLYSDRG